MTMITIFNYGMLGVTMLVSILLMILMSINHNSSTTRFRLLWAGLCLLIVAQVFDIFRMRILYHGVSTTQPLTYLIFVGYYLSAVSVLIFMVMHALLQFPWICDHSQRFRTIFFFCEFIVLVLVLTTFQTGFVYEVRYGRVQLGVMDIVFYALRLLLIVFSLLLLPRYHQMLPTRIYHEWLLLLLASLIVHIPPLLVPGLNMFAVFANLFFAVVYGMFYSNSFEEGTARMGTDMYRRELNYQLSKKKSFYVLDIRLNNYEALVERTLNRYEDKDMRVLYRTLDEELHERRNLYIYQKSVNRIAIIYSQSEEEMVEQVAHTVKETLSASFGGELQFQMVGIACPQYAASEADIMRLTYALRRQCQKGDFLMCTREDYEQYCERKDILALLGSMRLEKEDVVLFARPSMDTSGMMNGQLEILCRLQLAGKGIVHAEEVIRMAEQYGFIHDVNMLVLSNICEYLSTDITAFRDMRVSVHISGEELENPKFLADVCEIMQMYEPGPGRIEFEVEVTKKLGDIEHVKAMMQQLQAYQVGFILSGVDPADIDFESVALLPFSAVYFSAACIKRAAEDRTYYDMIGMLVDLLRDRGYRIGFKGIEDDELEDLAVSFGADFMQGEKYGHPFPIEELELHVDQEF